MKTYKNIDEFMKEAFPEEYDILIKRKKSIMEMDVENLDALFAQELEEAIKGKETEQKEEAVKGKKAENKEEDTKVKKAKKK